MFILKMFFSIEFARTVSLSLHFGIFFFTQHLMRLVKTNGDF